MSRSVSRCAFTLAAALAAVPATAESVIGSVSPWIPDTTVHIRETLDRRLGAPRVVELGDDGRFAVPWEGRGLLLELTAPGRRKHLRWIGQLPDVAIDVQLAPESERPAAAASSSPGTTVRGRVLDARGTAFPGAEISVVRIDFRSFTGLSVAIRPEGVAAETTRLLADGTGRFALHLEHPVELPSQNRAAFALVCRVPGRAAGTRALQRTASQDLDCRIGESGRALSGRLLQAPAGTQWPLHIVAATPGAPLTSTVITGGDGRFTTPEIFPDDVPGYLVLFDVPEARPEVVVVEGTAEKPIEISMRAGIDLPVRLVDAETGRAPEHAAVSAWITLGPMRLERQAIADGALRILRHLPPDSPAELRVVAPGYLPHRRTVDLSGARSEPLEVRLQPAARLEVRVQGPAGAVAGARVEISGPAGGPGTEAESGGSFAPDTFAVTGNDGRAAFESLPRESTVTVTCRAPGYAPWWREDVRLGKGSEQIDVDLAQGAVIEGQVLYEDGSPVADVPVTAVRVEADERNPRLLLASIPAQRETRTGDDGRFIFPPLAAGDYVVEPRLEDLELTGDPWISAAPPPIPIVDGDHVSGLDFFLHPPVDLRLWIDGDHDVLPARELRLTAIRRWNDVPFYGERHTLTAHPEDDGSFRIENLAAGVVDLEVRVPGARPARRPAVHLIGPETVLVVDDLVAGGLMTLSVLDAAGKPVVEAQARLFRLTLNETEKPGSGALYDVPENHPDLRSVSTDAAGEAVFDGLEAGDYQLHVRDDSGRYAFEALTLGDRDVRGLVERSVVLPEGQDVPIEVRAAGEPAAHTVVVLVRQEEGFEGIRHEAQTDADGHGRFEKVVPGTYRLIVHLTDLLLAGGGPEPSLIHVGPGARLTLEL